MREIKNFKGEIVKIESSYGDKWWHPSGSTWFLISGLVLGIFANLSFSPSILNILDPRCWPWEIFVLIPLLAAFLYQCGRIYRNWEYYDEDEEKHAKNFVWLGVTVLLSLLFVCVLTMTGRFFLFFRPLTEMFTRGVFSLAAIWRAVPIVVLSVPLLYFGKEWICGFWNK